MLGSSAKTLLVQALLVDSINVFRYRVRVRIWVLRKTRTSPLNSDLKSAIYKFHKISGSISYFASMSQCNLSSNKMLSIRVL